MVKEDYVKAKDERVAENNTRAEGGEEGVVWKSKSDRWEVKAKWLIGMDWC